MIIPRSYEVHYSLNLNQSRSTEVISEIWLIEIAKRGYCESVKFHWLFQWKLTGSTVKNTFLLMDQRKLIDLIVKNIFFAGESVKKQITDSISKNFTDSDFKSIEIILS